MKNPVPLKKKKATTIISTNGFSSVFLYQTEVFKLTPKLITLDTGGWATKTPCLRMEQAAKHFGMDLKVSRCQGQCYAHYKGQKIPFDGNTLELAR